MTVIDIHTHPHLGVNDLTPWFDYTRRCGIDRVVLLGDVLGGGYDPGIEQVRQINDNNFDLVAKHPGCCYGFCFLNATNDSQASLDELDRCRARGAVGVKMEVSAFASDARLDPIMRRLDELHLPLLHHSWNTWAMGRVTAPGCHQSDPTDIAALAARFPKVSIIAAHLRPNGLRGVWEVREHQNVCFDTSGGQPITGIIEGTVRLLGADRVLYGSDAYYPDGRDYAAQLACIDAARIPDRAKDKLLGLNALRLLEEARP